MFSCYEVYFITSLNLQIFPPNLLTNWCMYGTYVCMSRGGVWSASKLTEFVVCNHAQPCMTSPAGMWARERKGWRESRVGDDRERGMKECYETSACENIIWSSYFGFESAGQWHTFHSWTPLCDDTWHAPHHLCFHRVPPLYHSWRPCLWTRQLNLAPVRILTSANNRHSTIPLVHPCPQRWWALECRSGNTWGKLLIDMMKVLSVTACQDIGWITCHEAQRTKRWRWTL